MGRLARMLGHPTRQCGYRQRENNKWSREAEVYQINSLWVFKSARVERHPTRRAPIMGNVLICWTMITSSHVNWAGSALNHCISLSAPFLPMPSFPSAKSNVSFSRTPTRCWSTFPNKRALRERIQIPVGNIFGYSELMPKTESSKLAELKS